MPVDTPPVNDSDRRAFIVFAVTLAVMLTASLFPEYRLWGVGVWAHFPIVVPFVLSSIVVALGFRAGALPLRSRNVASDLPANRCIAWALGITIAFGLMFYLLRARAHFLGDGYLQISFLAKDSILVGKRSFGEGLVHQWVKSLLGGEGKEAALRSYQVVSIVSGVAFLGASAFFARMFFGRPLARVLFLLGMASSGYMLLFFGYVENYTLFCLSIALFTFIGIATTTGKLSRWWILMPAALAAFFHVLGVTLIPAALYVLIAGTRFGDALGGLSRTRKAASMALLVVLPATALYYFYTTSYFFRFALVSPVHTRFTIEGYTLFSWKHLADYANLLFLLVPGVGVLVATLWRYERRALWARREFRFLSILAACTLGAAFVFEPKLGMPRDWDLFSFPGVPLAALLYLAVLADPSRLALDARASVFAVTLGLLSLVPRAITQATPELAIKQFRQYAHLDSLKNRSGLFVLGEYYGEHGDTAAQQAVKKERDRKFPEEDLNQLAENLFLENRISQVREVVDSVLKLNPNLSFAWLNLGRCYINQGHHDSAVSALEIADGLNPYSPMILNELGLAYYYGGWPEKSERPWSLSAAVDSTQFIPFMSLARLYQTRGDTDRYLTNLAKAVVHPTAEGVFSKELGDQYAARGEYMLALEALARALERGVDTAQVIETFKRYPALRTMIKTPPTPP
jgi:tetratricopeptide (TPR) repeat protein